MNGKDPRKNASGCWDMTAYEAIKKADAEAEQERLGKVIKTIKNVCELAGFSIEGRIVLKDKRTGKVWR